jgi:hypothetical protein
VWTKPLAEFLLVEPAYSPLNAVAQHATDHLSGIDATHRTHVQETVTGAEVGTDQTIPSLAGAGPTEALVLLLVLSEGIH